MLHDGAPTRRAVSFWNRRRVTLTLVAAATGALVVVWLRAGDEAAETRPPPTQVPPATASPQPGSGDTGAPQAQHPPEGKQPVASGAPAPPVAPPVAAPIAAEPAPAPPMVPPSRAEADLPIDILLTAPTEAHDGNTIEITLGVTPGRGVQSAVFHVSYDPAMLEPLDLVDPPSADAPTADSAPAEVEVTVEAQQGMLQGAVLRFVAHAQAPQSTQLTVSAEAWDSAGTALTVGAPALHTMILWP